MALTRDQVLRGLRFRDDFTTRDAGLILDYVDEQNQAQVGDNLGNHIATQNLDLAGFEVDGILTINGPNSASGVDAPNMLIKGGSPAGSASADGAQIDIVGGDAQDLGQAGDVVIRGGNADRVPGGAVLISAGFTLSGTANTGGIITISTGQGGSVSGIGGSMNLITANGNGTGDAGKMSLRPGAGGTGGGDGGLFEVLGGAGQGGGIGTAIEITSGPGFFAGPGDSGPITLQVGAVPDEGDAGDIFILGSAGAGALGLAGRGSTINITAGATSNIDQDGGDIFLKAGNFTAGDGSNNGSGGKVQITTGSATFSNPDSDGGDFIVTLGSAGSGTGGTFRCTGGTGTSGGGGGGAVILGGSGGPGGAVSLGGGNGLTGSAGGGINLDGGSGSSTGGNGGDVDITGGRALGGASPGGDVVLTGGTSVGGIEGVINLRNAAEITVGRFDGNTTAGETRFMLWDVDNATLERVTVGAADSGGVGFKVLRIPN